MLAVARTGPCSVRHDDEPRSARPSKSFSSRIDQSLQRRDDGLHVVGRDPPDDVRIDVVITMDDPVTHARHGSPRKLWMGFAKPRRDSTRRLSQNLDEVKKCQLSHFIGIE